MKMIKILVPVITALIVLGVFFSTSVFMFVIIPIGITFFRGLIK